MLNHFKGLIAALNLLFKRVTKRNSEHRMTSIIRRTQCNRVGLPEIGLPLAFRVVDQHLENLPLVSIIAAIFLMLAASNAEAINKCVNKAGNVTYQEAKCPDNTNQYAIEPQGRSRPNGPGADDGREDAAIREIVAVKTGFERCVEVSPGFSERNAALYTAWHASNAVALKRFEHSERYELIFMISRRELYTQPTNRPGVRESLAKFCDEQFIPVLKSNIRK